MSALVVLGWLGNGCFFTRGLVQWLSSERQRKSVCPPLYWWLSLAGSCSLGVYVASSGESVLLAGFVIGAGIYMRNLALLRRPRIATLTPSGAGAIACLAYAGLLAAAYCQGIRPEAGTGPAWIACSLIGQSVWTGRFVIQWYLSERKASSHLPPAFWWISLLGNGLLLAYALHLRDPVLIAGYAVGPLMQVRNLQLLSHAPHRLASQH